MRATKTDMLKPKKNKAPGIGARFADPFAGIAHLREAVRRAPLPPVLFLSGNDEWFVGEGPRRIAASFRESFAEGEVTSYEGPSAARDAVSDASRVALFSTNQLVLLDASDLLRGKRLTAEEVEALLDEPTNDLDGSRGTTRTMRPTGGSVSVRRPRSRTGSGIGS